MKKRKVKSKMTISKGLLWMSSGFGTSYGIDTDLDPSEGWVEQEFGMGYCLD